MGPRATSPQLRLRLLAKETYYRGKKDLQTFEPTGPGGPFSLSLSLSLSLSVCVCVYIPTVPRPPAPQLRLRPLAMEAYGGPAQTTQVSKETYYRGKRDLLYADF
jgi:hypothetical protein